VKDAPFWDALERALPRRPRADLGDPTATCSSFKPQRRPPYPAKRSGEFQVWLDSVAYSRDYDFTGKRGRVHAARASTWEAGSRRWRSSRSHGRARRGRQQPADPDNRFVSGARLDLPKGRHARDRVTCRSRRARSAKRFLTRARGRRRSTSRARYEDVSFDLRGARRR
jgi:hypothetical protein